MASRVIHLVQDMYFRDFVYNRYHWNLLPPGYVEKLHNDYALINQYVIQKYALSNTITVPVSFDEETLNQLGRFSIYEFLTDMNADFQIFAETQVLHALTPQYSCD